MHQDDSQRMVVVPEYAHGHSESIVQSHRGVYLTCLAPYLLTMVCFARRA